MIPSAVRFDAVVMAAPSQGTLSALIASWLLAAVACGAEDVEPTRRGVGYEPPPPFEVPNAQDLARHVDPMIGTMGPGNVIPGALVPHGVVRASPDTNSPPGSIDAYDHDDDRIEGITHTHLEGPGGSSNGYNQLRFSAVAGAFDLGDPSSAFSHSTESADPGYYAVTLEDYDVRVELTATGHAAIHRYTFPGSADSRVVIDLGASNGRPIESRIEIVGDRDVRGHARYDVHPAVSTLLRNEPLPTGVSDLYFHARFDRPFVKRGTFQGAGANTVAEGEVRASGPYVGGFVGFETAEGDIIEVRVGISFIDEEQALRNLEDEVGEHSFDEVRAAARKAWNDKLNRIQIEAPEGVRTMFYTALYRSMFQPANHTEPGGRFMVANGGERHVREGDGRPFYKDDWCMWDTYRTTHPLASLLEPETRSDVVRSLLTMAEDGGWLPKCTWHATGYSRIMTGNNALPVIADAWTKGFRDFDHDAAWAALEKTSTQEVSSTLDGLCGYLGLGTPAEYISAGWVGHECDPTQAASMTLEHAYDDFCVAQVAEGLGRAEEAAKYRARSQNFRNQFNPDSGFMQPRLRDGSWRTPFDPADRADFNGFVEASAWIFTFFVPHDVPALIELLGGNDAFVSKLDQFFDEGHFDPSNQPSFHIPWLYGYAGAGARTQQRVHDVAQRAFSTAPDGLPGNDDAGSTSSWYVFAALGLYPVSPGEPVYRLSTPLVDHATIHLHPAFHDAATFVIHVERSSSSDVFIQSATLNGAPLDRAFLRHEEIVAGGTLRFVVGPQASSWGDAR